MMIHLLSAGGSEVFRTTGGWGARVTAAGGGVGAIFSFMCSNSDASRLEAGV